MDVKIDSVTHRTENQIRIVYYDDGFEEKISLFNEEREAYINNDVGFFIKGIGELEHSYREQHNELLSFLEEHDSTELWSEWTTDTVKEMAEELNGISDHIKRNKIVLKAMSEEAGSESS